MFSRSLWGFFFFRFSQFGNASNAYKSFNKSFIMHNKIFVMEFFDSYNCLLSPIFLYFCEVILKQTIICVCNYINSWTFVLSWDSSTRPNKRKRKKKRVFSFSDTNTKTSSEFYLKKEIILCCKCLWIVCNWMEIKC